MNRRRVVVTGMGLITPCGPDLESSWAALVAGKSGVGPITQFDASMCETRLAAEVRDFDPEKFLEAKEARRLARYQQFALAAAEMAMQDAKYAVTPADAHNAGVIVGSGIGGMATAESNALVANRTWPKKVGPFFILNVLVNMAASYVSIRFGFKGPGWATNSACATSAHALGEAYHVIARGDADVMLAGGSEAPIGFMAIAGFNAIRALSKRNDAPEKASRPFDRDRDGFVLGEGCGIVLLEELEHARARGARIHAELVGYGVTSDAAHVTAPAPEHEGAQRCMRAALRHSGLQASDIGYVNAHGTSTPQGDVAEASAIKQVFGPHAQKLLVSSTKSMTGHLTGAAGSTEAIISILAMQRGLVPPTINLDHPDEGIDLDCVPHVARPAQLRSVMTNSFGFGGTNACLVFSALEHA